MAAPIHAWFSGGDRGTWSVERVEAVVGEPLAPVSRLSVGPLESRGRWGLQGVASMHRYVGREEKSRLVELQPPLARAEAKCAALIPIKKNDAWWDLAQDERREIFEAKSAHISGTMRFLPQIARRLYHSRELGEPFDFLTWFEFAPEHRGAFDELVGMLRGTEEWKYVEREVDIRLTDLRDR